MFEKYDAYKDSGIQWIGQIPEHWEIEKAKWIFLKADRPTRPNDGIVTCFRDGEVTLRSNRRTDGFTNALKEHGYQGIRKDDLVIHAMDAFAGAIGVSDSEGKSTPVYSACIPRIKNRINVYYYAYYLRNLALAGFIESLAKGIRERSTDFRFADFAELLLPFPKLEDQERIVAFLNQKTSEIDQAIAIKQQQIALLNERKQIVIQKAVTQGLDLNVPMKDSGVEWIGQIPEHWEIMKLKYLISKLESGVSVNASESESASEKDIGVLKTSAVYKYMFDPNENKKVFKNEIRRVSCPVKAGSIIVSRMNAPDLVGASGYVEKDYTNLYLPDRLWQARFHTSDVEVPRFVSHILVTKGIRSIIESLATGSSPSMKNISKNDFLNIEIPLPPVNEIFELNSFIRDRDFEYIQSIELFKNQIEKLKEYKTTLINDAVTGKIKVA
ncbi:restriction endonuclease subunit S [Acinetobacter towneri]|nr:restriction endonuclease subunit S [Acinetobacter towneri]